MNIIRSFLIYMREGTGRKRYEGEDMKEKRSSVIVNFIIRAVVGFAVIFFLNQFLAMQGLSVRVGMNPVTFVTAGTLGAPGVALLYGISFLSGY